jgi:hypothetical protein
MHMVQWDWQVEQLNHALKRRVYSIDPHLAGRLDLLLDRYAVPPFILMSVSPLFVLFIERVMHHSGDPPVV